jgi:hypothetical protein
MDAPNREWRQVEEFPDYEVSNDGLLRSWKRKTRRWRNPAPGRRDAPVLVGGYTNARGYTAHILRKPDDPKPYRRLLHRLVAVAFLPQPKDGQTDVCHNDGNPRNNCVENLRWDSHHANQMDMQKHGTTQEGERCVTAKLTAQQVAFIRSEVARGPRGTQRKLAMQFNVCPATICQIIKNRTWRSA